MTTDGAQRGVGEIAEYAVTGGGDAPGRAVEWLGRVGLVAYGIVHLLVAGLGVRLALGAPVEADQHGAVAEVASVGPLGLVLLGVFVAGLAAFAVWQVCAAAVGFRWVSGSERLRKRVGAVAKAIAVVAIAVVAARFVLGDPASSGRDGPRSLAGSLIALPGGRVLVAAVAAVVVVIAVTMVFTGVFRTFMGDLVEGLPAAVRRTAQGLGAVGNLARAVAFGAVGVLFGVAAWRADPNDVGGLDLALRTLTAVPVLAVSVGFAAFGVYCFLDARYRRA